MSFFKQVSKLITFEPPLCWWCYRRYMPQQISKGYHYAFYILVTLHSLLSSSFHTYTHTQEAIANNDTCHLFGFYYHQIMFYCWWWYIVVVVFVPLSRHHDDDDIWAVYVLNFVYTMYVADTMGYNNSIK